MICFFLLFIQLLFMELLKTSIIHFLYSQSLLKRAVPDAKCTFVSMLLVIK